MWVKPFKQIRINNNKQLSYSFWEPKKIDVFRVLLFTVTQDSLISW